MVYFVLLSERAKCLRVNMSRHIERGPTWSDRIHKQEKQSGQGIVEITFEIVASQL